MAVTVEELVGFYRQVYEERFRDLPIINPELDVEAVGFRPLAEHELGALITPWFINLVLLPGSDRWQDRAQGSGCRIELPGAKVDFTVSHDETLGTTLSAALFSTVAEFPDQAMARDIAAETLRLLFTEGTAGATGEGSGEAARVSRRQLLRNLGGLGNEETKSEKQ